MNQLKIILICLFFSGCCNQEFKVSRKGICPPDAYICCNSLYTMDGEYSHEYCEPNKNFSFAISIKQEIPDCSKLKFKNSKLCKDFNSK